MSRQIKVSQEKSPGADFFRATTYLICFLSLYLALMSVVSYYWNSSFKLRFISSIHLWSRINFSYMQFHKITILVTSKSCKTRFIFELGPDMSEIHMSTWKRNSISLKYPLSIQPQRWRRDLGLTFWEWWYLSLEDTLLSGSPKCPWMYFYHPI
jgi:hypothetical protein